MLRIGVHYKHTLYIEGNFAVLRIMIDFCVT